MTGKYDKFSKAAGLPTQRERMQVAGFRRVKTKAELTSGGKNDIIYKKDIVIHKSLGSSGKNYPVKLPDGNHAKFSEGSKITKIKTFAGKGTNTPIRDAIYLENDYGISAKEWQKVRGEGTITVKNINRKAEIHWYEAQGHSVKMKVKRWLDES